MKLAKASQAEIVALNNWLQKMDRTDSAHRPPAFMRVVFGYETLVDNCCDPTKDFLDWKPGYAPSDTDRFHSALERIRDLPVSERVFSTVLGIVNEALKPTA